MEERLDKILLMRNLVSSRVRAEEIIRKYGVKVDGKLINKTGKKFSTDCQIELLQEEIPYVSRGALKLLEAIKIWNLNADNKTFIDIGASTGGFTEILLLHGAKLVYAVDVGRNQLHVKLKDDERVINLERTHVRELNSKVIPHQVDGIVIDVSFISLKKIFPFIHTFLDEDADVIALVKPQFEVGKEHVAKGGIVKNKALYPVVLEKIISTANDNQLDYQAHITSPVLGGDGNVEFLMHLKKRTRMKN